MAGPQRPGMGLALGLQELGPRGLFEEAERGHVRFERSCPLGVWDVQKPDELWTVQSPEGKAGPVQVNGQSRPMWVRTVGLRPAQRASTCLALGWGN